MAVLMWLTIGYAVILVLVLAVSLTIIAATLWSVGTTLGQVAGGLRVVEQQTAPLAGHLNGLNGGLGAVADGLRPATEHLAVTDAHLAAALGEPSALHRDAARAA